MEMPGARPPPIPRDKWQLAGNVVTLDGGFEPGRTYELAYRAANPPVAGLGIRRGARHRVVAEARSRRARARAKYAYAFGSSQSGRFLRDFLYEGFNTDERNRQVFDARDGAHRRRGADRPERALGDADGAGPVHGDVVSVCRRQAARSGERRRGRRARQPARARHQPKIFYTNTGVEYWGGGRSAALVHTTPDGAQDLALPDNVRVYFLAGTQHWPGAFPSGVDQRPAEGQSDRLLVDDARRCWWRWTSGSATASRRRRAGIRGCRTARWCARPTSRFRASRRQRRRAR